MSDKTKQNKIKGNRNHCTPRKDKNASTRGMSNKSFGLITHLTNKTEERRCIIKSQKQLRNIKISR